jgi:ABC-type Mn2+/Zn2+ transport system permease subunit
MAEAFLDVFSTLGSVDDEGSTVDVLKGNKHFLTSSTIRFWGLSQPTTVYRQFYRSILILVSKLTRVRPLLALSIDTTRASIEGRTPTTFKFYLILQTRATVDETVTCFERC